LSGFRVIPLGATEGDPPMITRRAALLSAAAALAACGRRRADTPRASGDTPEMRRLIDKYAALYDVPGPLIHRVVRRESGYRADARNGPYFGLMQIHPQTAATMGYRGPPSGLLNADTNLRYAVKYLRGAWLLSNGSYDRAVMWYARGYYYEAKRRGMLVETGLKAA
jgi:soluble lytic murein transglycosylase-like protein